jgi:MerR family transcriptional regulator, copper efflux regulator
MIPTVGATLRSTRVLDKRLSESFPVRVLSITDAAKVLRTTPRMLRYRESLGLLPSHGSPGAHRRYDDEALRAAAYAIMLERTYDVSPSALAFALRVLNDPVVNADVRRLSQLTGPGSAPLAALDFDQQKARRLLLGRNSILPRA